MIQAVFAMFVICLDNRENPASLIVGKVYRRLEDPEAEKLGLVRIVDEDTSEPEGYLYPAAHFEEIQLSENARQKLFAQLG